MQTTLYLPRTRARRSLRPSLMVAGAVLIAVCSHLLAAPAVERPAPAPSAAVLPLAADPLQPLAEIDRAIATWTANLERNSHDYIAATHLAELYLGRSRLTADPADLDRALGASRRALDASPGLPAAAVLRAQVRLAGHDFAGARTDALALLARQPALPQALATLGDAQLELGDYAGARRTYAALADRASGPAVAARVARLEAITGGLDAARGLAAEALASARSLSVIGATERAWYATLVGSLAFQAGDLPGAAASYEAALEDWPGSAAALAGLARTRSAGGDAVTAIELYRRSVAIVPNPEALAALGDLLTIAGRDEEAAAAYAQVEGLARLAGAAGLHDRQLAIFLANHGRDPNRAVMAAVADLARREDVYAHDAHAWALHAAGRHVEADAAMRLARAAGTQDALLDYHAGMIAASLGRASEARSLLSAALERNPGFDSLQAERAASTLASLGGDR